MDGSSYRRLGTRWKVHYATAWRRVQRTLHENVKTGTLIGFRLPQEVRVLMLDAKHFKIRRDPFTLYVAFNAETMRPLSWILLPRHELRAGYDRILRHFRRNKLSILGIVSDWHVGLRASVQDHYPTAIHQHCAFHVLADVLRKLGGKRFINTGSGKKIWIKVRRVALESGTLIQARNRLYRLRHQHPEYLRAWKVLHHHLPGIYEFAKLPVLADHRTSNRLENFMGILEQRLKSCRSLKTPDQCAKIISSLIAVKYKRSTK